LAKATIRKERIRTRKKGRGDDLDSAYIDRRGATRGEEKEKQVNRKLLRTGHGNWGGGMLNQAFKERTLKGGDQPAYGS